MWDKLKKLFSKEQPVEVQVDIPFLITRDWRKGMWVVCNGLPAILVTIADPCEIHYVDKKTGETTNISFVPITALRQAKFTDIPECRLGISEEKAKELGYGT